MDDLAVAAQGLGLSAPPPAATTLDNPDYLGRPDVLAMQLGANATPADILSLLLHLQSLHAHIFLIIMFGRTRPKISYTCSSRRAPHRGCAIVRAPARGCRARVMPCATRARPPVRWKMRRSPAPAQGARPRRRAAVRRYVVCKPTTSTVAPVATAR